jgi:quinol monooxygenase YgiN
MTLQAKPEAVTALRDYLSALQERIIDAGALTASLMQDEDNPSHFLEVDVWLSAEEYKRFFEAASNEGILQPLDALLQAPLQVAYLDTVKYSRSRRR